MAAHRAQLLMSFLSNAMSTGFTEIEPELEQLKVTRMLSTRRQNN
jgi:hypothetical protein